MTYTVKELREALYSIIRRLGERPERYARNPGRDFTRKRALTPAVLIHLILTMDAKAFGRACSDIFRREKDSGAITIRGGTVKATGGGYIR